MQGADLIKHYCKNLPHQAGVYRMLDAAGKVLYVGKARDLKNRVSNYTTLRDKNLRLSQMITQTASMEFVTTRNESEALLLEANLIRKLKPRYNILLRDDKSFPYLLLTAHDFPQIRSYRGAKTEKGDYFGPFASAKELHQSIEHLQRVLLLRPCKDSFFEKRTRPCLQYQIKRCSAPCVGLISQENYAKSVSEAKKLLRGQSRAVQEALQAEMNAASEALEYEKAAGLRDRLKALTRIQQEQGLQVPSIDEADVVALAREGNLACVQVFFYRGGQNFGNLPYFLSCSAEQSDGELLAAFLPQFYQQHEAPKLILLSSAPDESDWLESALSITLVVPQRGEKREVVERALKNAAEALRRKRDESLKEAALLEGVAKIFNLLATPKRIEVYDNSHISGTHAVGGMIVAGPDGLMKKEYRKFNIKTASGDDDFAMMREVLSRRLKSIIADDGEASRPSEPSASEASPHASDSKSRSGGNIPDLLLIDGGAGQLSAALEVLNELGLSIPVVGIAKGPDRNAGRERFFMPVSREKDLRGQQAERFSARSAQAHCAEQEAQRRSDQKRYKEFSLEMNDPVLHYLQRLRDEVHRYAIGTHRAKRSAAITKSELDTLTGIGAKRKKALLHHFGSSRAVANASMDELAQVEGISTTIAQGIWNHFHG